MAYLGALDEAHDLDASYTNLLDSLDDFESCLYSVDYVAKNHATQVTEARQLRNKISDLGDQILDLSTEVHNIVYNLEQAAYLATTQFAEQRSTKPTPTNIAKVQKLLKLNYPETAEIIINYYNEYYA